MSINETIRKELPVKHILKEYLGNDYIEDESQDFDDPKKDNFNLKKMVMHEIQNCSSEKLNKVKLILQNTEPNLDDNDLKKKYKKNQIPAKFHKKILKFRN